MTVETLPPAISEGRRRLLPAPTLPLVYFAGAHVSLAVALAVLVVMPDLPGAYHYHPRMIGLLHLLTLGWISGSILGAFYIVAPLALGMPFPARVPDAIACASFWIGTAGMVAGFWLGRFEVVGLASLFVIAALVSTGLRAAAGLGGARVPQAVALHVVLAFANVVVAGIGGTLLAIGRFDGGFGISPIALAAAHAHFAVIGWAVMMVVGLSYRLVPMFLPAAMPTGWTLALGAVFLEIGAVALAWAFITGESLLVGVVSVCAGLGTFVVHVRRILGTRRARPAGMEGRDWSSWQTHVALLHLPVACALGIWLASREVTDGWTWVYGGAGLLGFVAQMVVGIQGRLLPLHAWYRAMERRGGTPPDRSVHRLPVRGLALAVFLLWLGGVPVLVGGLGLQHTPSIATGAAALLAAVLLQVIHGVAIVRRAEATLEQSDS